MHGTFDKPQVGVCKHFIILIVRLEYRTFEYMRVDKLIYSKCMTIWM